MRKYFGGLGLVLAIAMLVPASGAVASLPSSPPQDAGASASASATRVAARCLPFTCQVPPWSSLPHPGRARAPSVDTAPTKKTSAARRRRS